MFFKNQIWKTMLALVLVATLMSGSLSAVQAQSGPPPMFGDAGDVPLQSRIGMNDLNGLFGERPDTALVWIIMPDCGDQRKHF